MNPAAHLRHLDRALVGFRFDSQYLSDLRIGALVPDFGALSELAASRLELDPADPVERILLGLEAESAGSTEIDGAGEFLLRSHRGDFAALHAMASRHRMPPSETLDEIRTWARFFADLACGTLAVEPGTRIGDVVSPVGPWFRESGIAARDIFGDLPTDRIAVRAAGALVHLVQDFFTVSHVELDVGFRVAMFHHFPDQDVERHLAADDATPGSLAELDRRTISVLDGLVRGAVRTADLFEVGDAAVPSGGGAFA